MSAKIASAIHAVMQDVSYVQKTGTNRFHNYRYASEGDLLDKLRPALIKHGLILIPSTRSVGPPDQWGNVTIIVEYTLVHKDGDVWPTTITAPGCGNDRAKDGKVGDKGLYKALTGANKYLLFKLFQIETGDDPELDSVHEQPSRQDSRPITTTIAQIDPNVTSSPTRDLHDAATTAVLVSGISTAKPSKQVYIENAIKLISEKQSASQLLEWATKERKMVWPQYGIEPHDKDGQKLVAAYKARMAVLTGETEDME